jgi:hypothetical protein
MRKMMMLAAMLALAVLMMAAAPAMAQGNHNNNDDNNKNNNDDNHFVRNFDRFDNNRFERFDNNDDNFCDFFDCDFDRFDRFDNGFNNGFGDFEQEADSGDVAQSFQVINTGENANQCVGITGNANTGNAQNQLGLTQFDAFGNPFFVDDFGFFHNGFNDFEFDDTGADLTVLGTSTTTCAQQVNQAAAAG